MPEVVGIVADAANIGQEGVSVLIECRRDDGADTPVLWPGGGATLDAPVFVHTDDAGEWRCVLIPNEDLDPTESHYVAIAFASPHETSETAFTVTSAPDPQLVSANLWSDDG